MTIKDYCKVNDVQINEKEVKSFESITKTNADVVFDNMKTAMDKYNVDKNIKKYLLEDVDAWFYLYKNPLDVIKKHIKNGKIDSNGLYARALVD